MGLRDDPLGLHILSEKVFFLFVVGFCFVLGFLFFIFVGNFGITQRMESCGGQEK